MQLSTGEILRALIAAFVWALGLIFMIPPIAGQLPTSLVAVLNATAPMFAALLVFPQLLLKQQLLNAVAILFSLLGIGLVVGLQHGEQILLVVMGLGPAALFAILAQRYLWIRKYQVVPFFVPLFAIVLARFLISEKLPLAQVLAAGVIILAGRFLLKNFAGGGPGPAPKGDHN